MERHIGKRAKWLAFLAALALIAAACGSSDDDSATEDSEEANPDDGATSDDEADSDDDDAGNATSAPVSDELDATVNEMIGLVTQTGGAPSVSSQLDIIASSDEVGLAWLLSDVLRFTQGSSLGLETMTAAQELAEVELSANDAWGELTNHLISTDIPAPEGYLGWKRTLYSTLLPEWEPLFDDNHNVDWRHVSWGGVRIDDRPYNTTDEPCNCIPAADNPEVTNAEGGSWYPDEGVVFGVEINGESRAYPRNIMEIREMVNDTLGGRDIAMPYCTLCGSAQVYFTDEVPDGVKRPILRTSGLLIRSNKVMYDIETFSVFDTFLGTAVTGPLFEQGIVLPQHTVITTTWGDWKQAHPDTTILREDLALGRDSDLRNSRDANGPIFPIGDVDPRLPVQEDVIGVTTESGTPIAFQVSAAIEALEAGGEVSFENIHLELSGGGVRALDADGNDVGGHQAFWFAWSQFHPGTELWEA